MDAQPDLFPTFKERIKTAMQRFMQKNAPVAPAEEAPKAIERSAEDQARLDRLARESCQWVYNGFKGPQPR